MVRCFIALGSNLEQPLEQVNRAIEALAKLPNSRLEATSPWYQSTAIGPGNQADYINGVAELCTTQKPLQLLSLLQQIENQQQRKRLQHWGPRTLDLDLLLYGDQVINEATLTVPHARMLERNFVLCPLHDIAPDLVLPGGIHLQQSLAQLSMDGLSLVETLAETKSSNTIAAAPPPNNNQ
ncbi:MAG TPA: 2-amino-4-hydroxy-6-hydroxymethyldihydropteridine diphosphokinase [Porticoccus sp.]|nr:2-amino-4-hydroxy-6-hydroxymethyldihydropteridine diphosphokinase [Porticoccus sp.]